MIALCVLIALIIGVLLFIEQINRFLFHPEGLSIASSDLCVANEAGLPLIVQLSIAGGANSVTLVDDKGEACSPAPEENLPAEIRFSIADGQGPFCTLETVSGKVHALLLFDAPDNCEWAER